METDLSAVGQWDYASSLVVFSLKAQLRRAGVRGRVSPQVIFIRCTWMAELATGWDAFQDVLLKSHKTEVLVLVYQKRMKENNSSS